jgi:HK97 family phage prohead protease
VFEAMISTEDVDRMGDIVRADGAKIDSFMKNPVVLWAHDYGAPPVAKAVSIEIIPQKGIKATFQFPEWAVNPQADIVRRLWAGGFLNATSIGFIPIKASNLIDGDTNPWGPKDFLEWEMLEFSIVPVPANQNALRLAIKAVDQPEGTVTLEKECEQCHEKFTMSATLDIENKIHRYPALCGKCIDLPGQEDSSNTDDGGNPDAPNDEIESELAEELNKLYHVLVSALTPKGKEL